MKQLSSFFLLFLVPMLSFTQNIGIGTTSPATKLDVNGQLTIRGGTPGANKVLTSDAAGIASWQNSSMGTGFFVYRNTFQSISSGISSTVDFATVSADAGSNYNAAGDYFNCPTSGFYHFDFNILLSASNIFSGDKYINFGLYVNGAQYWEMQDNITYVSNTTNHGFGMNIYLTANDKVSIHVNQNTGVSQFVLGAFSGYRVY